ncbi:MAG: prolyl oligopeptidase family serine peptidase [Bacteroidales bacterium]|nr:prolyl oligopeptidase family serine peptidase [Bacteroidales bacterium]
MKPKTPFNLTALLALFLVVISCHNDDDVRVEHEYLQGIEKSMYYSTNIIKLNLSPRLVEFPELMDIIDRVKYNVQLYKVTYMTTCYDTTVVASGICCLPVASGKFPVVSFQNGTNTSHDNAPSVNVLNPNYAMMEFMASLGYVVLITDYIGFGNTSDMVHPYYHRQPTDQAVIDLIRAFNEVKLENSSLASGNDTLYMMGYSQGGWATLSSFREIETNYSDMYVSAVSCGAGAYDLTAMSDYVLGIDSFPGPLYLPYFIYSQQIYGKILDPLSKFFTSNYAEKIPDLFDGSYSNNEVNAQLTTSIPDLLTADMLENYATGSGFSELRDVLYENSITGWNTQTALRFYHGTMDDNVPPDQSSELYEDFIDAGASASKIQYIPMDGYTHETGLVPWGVMTINWFNLIENY